MNIVHIRRNGSRLDAARIMGGKLFLIKKLAAQGTWLSVLTRTTRISPRQAQKYLKIYRHWGILPVKADFTIDQAYSYINKNT